MLMNLVKYLKIELIEKHYKLSFLAETAWSLINVVSSSCSPTQNLVSFLLNVVM